MVPLGKLLCVNELERVCVCVCFLQIVYVHDCVIDV